MNRLTNALAALAVVALLPAAAFAAEKEQITLAQLQEMFADMRTKPGFSKWKVDGDLLWGYFFTSHDPKKLRPVAEYLSNHGYRIVSIYRAQDKSTHFLHVERIEHHTPESLHKRNLEFYELARRFQLESYDGMDVGPVKQ